MYGRRLISEMLILCACFCLQSCNSNPIRESNEILEQPVRTAYVLPIYANLAAKAGIEGSVEIEFSIDRNGRTFNIFVTKPAALKAGFEESTTIAIEQWKYQPALYNGEPVEVTLTCNAEFLILPTIGATVFVSTSEAVLAH